MGGALRGRPDRDRLAAGRRLATGSAARETRQAECWEYIAEVEGQLDRARWNGGEETRIVTFMPAGLDCKGELDDLFRGVR